jgi:nicotinamide mononucleotide transporter
VVTIEAEAPTRDTRLVANRHVVDSLWIAALATGLSYAVGFAFGWVTSVDPLEGFAVFTSYSSTYLCVRERRFNYPIGALSTAAYCLLFWRQGLYASMALNAYLTPALIYGWIRWRADAVTRPVTRVAGPWVVAYVAVTALAFAGALRLTSALGGSFATADTVILVGSLLAQFLLDNKKLETWAVWFVVDAIAVWEYVSSGLAIAGLQYVFFLANAAWGWVVWAQSRQTASRNSEQ